MCQGFFLLGNRIPTLQLPLLALRRLGWTFSPYFNSSLDISGIEQYFIFCTHPESLHLCACLSFFFLIRPSLSSFWDPLIPPDPARCYPLWSYHPDHPGPSSFLLHLSSHCSLLTPPCWSLPHFSLYIYIYTLVCPHYLLSYPTLIGNSWKAASEPCPPLSTQWLSAQHRRQKSMREIKECKPACFPG